ncbi:hypothetical protein JKP88DRAFT_309923 [Tribonema minus]|uniref:Uncharacterized protein n=1 Tax=Tribonema minus TaxID=303371 RepID=A0A835Z6U1_9STRA|nr:hypothetical protein JKP88DRAFT_309923 [Tribonema minus]
MRTAVNALLLVLLWAVVGQAFTPVSLHGGTARLRSTSFKHQRLSMSSGGGADPSDLDTIPDVKSKDWRAFRANLVRRSAEEGFGAPHRGWSGGKWAHDIGCVEKGCVLLAHESLEGVFYQTVVLILDHDDTRGTLGLIINRPTKKRIAGVPGLGRDVQRAFGDCPVLYGGPVGAGGMTALHSAGEAKGCQEVAPSVYVGGLEGLVRLAQEATPWSVVRRIAALLWRRLVNLGGKGRALRSGGVAQRGHAHGSTLRLAVGHAAWVPGQEKETASNTQAPAPLGAERLRHLKRELRANFWYVASAAPELITGPFTSAKQTSSMWHQLVLHFFELGFHGLYRRMRLSLRAGFARTRIQRVRRPGSLMRGGHASLILGLMGGEFADVAQRNAQ